MSTSRLIQRVINIGVLCFSVLAASAYAQNTTGSIVGQVMDATGAAVSNATVIVTNDATRETHTVQTNDTGAYQVLTLQPGQYKVDVDSAGFKHYSRDPVEVQVELTSRINVPMEIGTQNEQVTITSQAPIIQSENAALGQVVQGRAVTEMPLNGRNVLALVGLVPGVVPQGGSSGNLTGQNVFSAGNYQIGGGNANQSSTLVDGAPVNISYGNATILVPSQDSVQEFRVQTNNNTAEYGMYAGGVINITTKSGTNSIHGTAYEFLRNTVFNSTPYFSKHSASPLAKNPLHQNQFGGNISFPIIKDKLFGFFDYQGYRNTTGLLYNYTVPTAAERSGDFSALSTPIYDPLTTCGTGSNPACTDAQRQGLAPTRTQFSYKGQLNVIDPARFSTVAKNLIAFPYWAAPTNNALTQNFQRYATAGGNNDQYNGRVDYALSDKQRIFGRYTQWNSKNIAPQTYNNGLITGDQTSPESFSTKQIVAGDSYLFNPTSIGDIRISYTRWNYQRTPGTLGYDETQLGLPSYFGQIAQLNNLTPSTTVPAITMTNPTINNVGTGLIKSINSNYVIAPSFTKTLKNHTLKVGADLRRLDQQYFQNNAPGGTFAFDNVFTGKSASAASGTGNPFASFLLGYGATGTVQIAPSTYTAIYYQGYFISDTWLATPKLTLTLGLRYEIPGTYRERNQRIATFNPTEVNPVLGSISVGGNPVLGAFDLVGTPQHPAAGERNEHYTDFLPRLGLAYRVDDNTVIRAGWGMFVLPSDLTFTDSPVQSGINYVNNVEVTSNDNGNTPSATLDNPYPSGLTGAPGRNPAYQQILLGGSANSVLANEENGITYQWNFAVQRQMPMGIAVEAAYAGLHGSHLPVSIGVNQVPASYLSQAAGDPACNQGTPSSTCFLTKQVTNPLYGRISQGNLQNPTVPQNQLLRPFPQYGNISNPGSFTGFSNYNALQAKVEKRFHSGGVLLGSYTFSKMMTNAESLTQWLEATGNAPAYQNLSNLGAEYSLSEFDTRQRLVISYVYSLPFGRGQAFGSNVHGLMDKVVSGWGVNGVTTFQEGFPLGISMQQNNITTYALQGSTRPNVVPGVNKKIGGAVQKRLGDASSTSTYFNTAAFTAPATAFSFGNESRLDSSLRAPGQANYDLALYKDTHLTERVLFQFRVESFNLFNRVQFGVPNTAIGNAQVGQITTQLNQPRLLQLSGRFNF
ncbi:TonB-dependent receptor [Granulicella sp. WH15]|uniref:TonB-dependent receptor n=1 Tax=Granulicella sp. WH15 TaxID=2602070 RepID=UPI001367702C|nr:carboxypeptidase regulatory-like domain-containing protein [Granulicella sp. WH15]QHN04203.1 TonB-dependent receptor [Granulicella sp. WH15]